MAGLIEAGEVKPLPSRRLTQETCAKFGYSVGKLGSDGVQIAPYYDADNVLVAQKIRRKDKTFALLGDLKDAMPFGAQCWPKAGKKIVVTEGEIDALSMSQVQGNDWPVVSIGCGAGPQIRKYMARHRDYFNGFERIVLMFDMDEPGREASRIAAEVLGPKARIAELPLKDANEMLVAGRVAELIDAMWKALPYRPEGLLQAADLRASVLRDPSEGLSWAFPALTKLTFGIRTGELYALGAGTGVGKSDFLTQNIMHLITEHKVGVGVFALEQQPTETLKRIAGKFAKKTFHVPRSGWQQEDLVVALDTIEAAGKLHLYDNFGNCDWEIIKNKIEYLVHAEGVRYFFLDHLTALAAWQDDERKALELIMSDLGSLVKKLDIAIILVSHLATPEGRPHEEGGRVMIRHFKGSRSIGYWCHYMFGLERDQQAEDSRVRFTTVFRCLKDRYTGQATGQVFYLGYDSEQGWLYETDAPEDQPQFTDESNTTKAPDEGLSDF